MHDIDRTQNSFESDYESDEFEFMDEGDFYGEFEAESALDEMEESELASDLLEVTDEAELDQFLGNLIKKVAPKASQFLKSPLGQKLGGMLKGAAKKFLPVAGAALGNFIVPGIGGKFGGQLASKAGSMLGMELEGLSPQDQEFEVARQFVRLANEATQQALQAPPSAPPEVAARTAVIEAAKKFAPGLIKARPNGTRGRKSRSGRWERRGNAIILHGVYGAKS